MKIRYGMIPAMILLLGAWTKTETLAQEPAAKPSAAATTATPAAAPKEASTPPALATDKGKISYCIGLDIGRNFKSQDMDIDPAIVGRGIQDALSDSPRLLTDQEINAVFTAFRQQMMAKQQERVKAQTEKTKQEGEKFLAENKTKEGVVTLPSGLQYKVLVAGQGPSPKATDTVVTNYRGTLINGVEFDSSYKRNEPATFGVAQVIRGWTEALQLMNVGAKWQLFVPANLAYGEESPGPEVPPNSTLIFEVELLSIK
jgi:FKBP-type peptidyl-prolyl cis-trans isomerase FklB